MTDPRTLNPRLSDYDFSLYFVTDTAMCQAAGRSVAQTAALAVTGGAGVVQLREKQLDDPAVYDMALELFAALAHTRGPEGRDVPVFLDDRVDVVRKLRDRGLPAHLHIGQSDISPQQARSALGPEPLLGLSAHTAAQFRAGAATGGVDLFGVGPVWATQTKDVQRDALGVQGWAELAPTWRDVGIPAVAIGGIKAHNVARLRDVGALGVCVVSDICTADDPRAAAAAIRAAYLSAGATR